MASYLFDRDLYFNIRKRRRFYSIFDLWFSYQYGNKDAQRVSSIIEEIEDFLSEINSPKVRRSVFCNFQIAFLLNKVQTEVISHRTTRRVKLAYIEELNKYEGYYDFITNILQDIFEIGINTARVTVEAKHMNREWDELVYQLTEFQKEIELHKTGNSKRIFSPKSPDYIHTAYLIFAHDHDRYHWGTPPTKIDGRHFRAQIYTEKSFVENVILLTNRDDKKINMAFQILTDIARVMGIIDQNWSVIKTNFYDWKRRAESKGQSLKKICTEMKSILNTQERKERILRKSLGDKLLITSNDTPFYSRMLVEYAFWLFANWEGFTDTHIKIMEQLPVEFPS